MPESRKFLVQCMLALAVVAILIAVPAQAQQEATHSKTGYRFSYTPIYQFEADLDGGGLFDVQRHFLRFDVTRFIDRQWMVGLGLSLDYERWNFSAIEGLAGIDPWDEIVRPGISVPIIYKTASGWRWMAVPRVEFAGASGAEVDEALSYGAVLAAMHAVGRNLMVGLGIGLFDRLDEWEFFPFLTIDWRINDRFTLSNPFQAGPAGPAGLELTATPNDRWQIGAGGAYRSYRFRLDDTSAVADGIGEVEGWVAFLRLGWRFTGRLRLDLNTGALIGGTIAIDDENGNERGETDFDTAPFIGLTISGQF